MMNRSAMNTAIYTSLALLAFAGNSVICRLALQDGEIDAASFTSIRLIAGIIVLSVILHARKPRGEEDVKSTGWMGAIYLFIYAATFSFAYTTLETGIGALVLFGAVQITMIGKSLLSGTRLHYSEWIGLIVAFSGFIYLVLPDITSPSVVGFALMTLSGIAWGLFTLRGRNAVEPLRDITTSFQYTLPFVVLLLLANLNDLALSSTGFLLAILSGGMASALGYIVWYRALQQLTATQAAVLQLLVPVIAAFGGVIFANEVITHHLVIASASILGGVLLVIVGRRYLAPPNVSGA